MEFEVNVEKRWKRKSLQSNFFFTDFNFFSSFFSFFFFTKPNKIWGQSEKTWRRTPIVNQTFVHPYTVQKLGRVWCLVSKTFLLFRSLSSKLTLLSKYFPKSKCSLRRNEEKNSSSKLFLTYILAGCCVCNWWAKSDIWFRTWSFVTLLLKYFPKT